MLVEVVYFRGPLRELRRTVLQNPTTGMINGGSEATIRSRTDVLIPCAKDAKGRRMQREHSLGLELAAIRRAALGTFF